MSESEILKSIIQRRRSVFPKDYTDAKIPQSVVEEIIESANYAPNHKKTKPWFFRVFQDQEKEKFGQKLADVYQEITAPEVFLEKKHKDISAKINKADVLLAVCVNFSGMVPEWEEIAATAMAVQNMYLTCTANGVGCYWSTPGLKDHLQDYLQLEEHQKCYGFFYMGALEA